MIHDPTIRIGSASSRTRIHALVVHAAPARRAVRGRHALGPAAGRNADHAGHAGALGHPVDDLTLGVVPAGMRTARIRRKWSQNALDGQRRPDGCWNDLTVLSAVRIAGVARRAVAERDVIGYGTDGLTAKARTGVNATPVETGLRGRTLRVRDALWPAAGQFRAGVTWQANADGRAGRGYLALAIGHLAGIRIAGLDDGRRSGRSD